MIYKVLTYYILMFGFIVNVIDAYRSGFDGHMIMSFFVLCMFCIVIDQTSEK